MLMTTPVNRVPDVPFVLGQQNRAASLLPSRVRGLATSENGQAIAMAVDDQLWIWQQYAEEVKGIGFWTDLTLNRHLGVGVQANHPSTQSTRPVHGMMRPRQTFTLMTVLAPNLPQNSAVSYQDLCMFDNPDEGRGICCLTVLLPPCKPFDTLYLFNSICVFKGVNPTFQRADLTLDIVEGGGGPCVWWSLDCRLAVIAVSKSLVIVARFLRLVARMPLKDVFAGDELFVSSVAWSCCGRFFVITSTTGKISAVTRSGVSMRHALCSLAPFGDKPGYLMATGDAKDPATFVIYSKDKFRSLRIDPSLVRSSLRALMYRVAKKL
jgi:hypothetical protein